MSCVNFAYKSEMSAEYVASMVARPNFESGTAKDAVTEIVTDALGQQPALL
jgi:hypothetical protein